MTAVESAISEMQDLLVVFAPEHEGLRDFARLNLLEATQVDVRKSIINYDRREVLLNAAIAALQALMADGHPTLPVRHIDMTALNDLKANAATIEAALLRFDSNAATDLTLTGGTVEPKS